MTGLLLFAAAALAVGAMVFGKPLGDDPGASGDYTDTPLPEGDTSGIDPQDRSTWPSGDAYWKFCQAIAYAEGYSVYGSVPSRACNPGDLGPGDTGVSEVLHASGSDVSVLPSHDVGWQLLRNKVVRIFAGQSHVYSPTMSILQMAQKYAGDWSNWSKNVATDLGVDVHTTLRDWINNYA